MSKCSSRQWTSPSLAFSSAPRNRPQKPPAEELVHHRCHSLDLSCAGCHHPATHTQKHSGQGRERGVRQGFWQRGAAAVHPAAALKTRVRVLFHRQAEEEYEEDMRYQAAGGTSDGAPCCRCVVPGASFLCAGGRGRGRGQGKNMRRRHATHPPAVPMVERDAEGGGGGDLTGGPLDGQTNRGLNPRRRRAPSMAHTTRPSMPLTAIGTKMV